MRDMEIGPSLQERLEAVVEECEKSRKLLELYRAWRRAIKNYIDNGSYASREARLAARLAVEEADPL